MLYAYLLDKYTFLFHAYFHQKTNKTTTQRENTFFPIKKKPSKLPLFFKPYTSIECG